MGSTIGITENGVTKTADTTVTIKASAPPLTGISVSCPSSVDSGAHVTCTSTATYGDGSTKSATPTWSVSNTSVANINNKGMFWDGGVLTAGSVTTDTQVTVSATYTENGVTQTATATVTVKASSPPLTGITASCPATVTSGSTGTCSVTATYGDNSTKSVSATWTSSNTMVATISGNVLTAGTVTTDTPVSINASYTENGVTKTATAMVNVKAATSTACSGTGSNLSSITVVGNPVKKLGGDSLEVDYCLKNFNTATNMDVYVAVQLPDGTLLFMQAAGFFSMPTFTGKTVPYLTNTLIPDKSGPVLNMPAIPMGLSTGTYTFYAIPVLAGKDLMNFTNWVGNLAKGQVTLSQ